MRGVFLQVRLRLGTRPSAVPVAGWDAVPPRDASHNAHADRRSCTSHATETRLSKHRIRTDGKYMSTGKNGPVETTGAVTDRRDAWYFSSARPRLRAARA